VNSREAKQILFLYRPGLAEQDEPGLDAALALAEQDPELGRWFHQHRATQETLRASFRQLPVPEGLKEQILSERKAHTALPMPRKLVLIALSVVIMFLLAGVSFSLLHRPEDRTFANFQSRMVRTVARQYPKMDLETSDLGKIRRYLAQHQAPGDYVLPPRLENTTSTGCALLQWRGKQVSMICFNSGLTPTPNVPDLFLFVINRADVPNAPSSPSPLFTQGDAISTATWSAGDKTYLLTAQGGEPFLRRYF